MAYKKHLTETQCDQCGITYQKDKYELKRNKDLGRKSFCSRNCQGKSNIVNITERSDYDISQHANNKRDEFTGLREHLRRAKGRNKEIDIEVQDLLDQWIKQDGICPYSKIKLTYPKKGINDPITTASLDRIDSSKGYIKQNIQFVSTAINYMKAQMTHEQTIELCKLIAINYHE